MSGSSGQGTINIARDTSTFLSADDDQDISALLSGMAWSGTSISFSFPDAATDYGTARGNGTGQYPDPAPFNGFSQFTVQEIGETLRAFGLIASYTNLAFSRITDSSTTHATVRLANSTSPATSYAYNPSISTVGGDVFLGPSAANPIIGNYASGAALIHEIGHALGLVHGQGDFDKNNKLLNPYGVMNPGQLDIEYSLMNYPSYVGGPNQVTASTLPQTYMMYDIAAFQYMYGANFSQAGQNNTYTWSTSTGEEFVNGVSQGTPVNNHIFATIWSAGANSTYDLSNFTADQIDDMNPGGWMLFSPAQRADLDTVAPGTHVAQGDIYNALEFNGDRRSLIDNLFTGSGNDTITGNAADNIINSGGGTNTITGGPGADKFIIDASLLPGGLDDIKDYDQGNSGSFAASEGDQIDLSALFSAAYNKGAGAAVTSLVRSIEDPGGLFAAVQIYTGAISSWTKVAELFGVTTSEQINVILDATLPAGSSVPTTAVSPVPQQSPVVLDDFGWAQGWGSPNNPRMTVDVDRNGTTDYVGFGFQAVSVSDGGIFSDGQGHNGPGFTSANFAVNDFGAAEGYTADVQRGVAFTGNPLGDTIYGQGFVGVYWYAPTGATPQMDRSGKTYDALQYQSSPSLYDDFGSQQGWTPHNGFQILKTNSSDNDASILGFGTAGIVVGPQAFAPGATAAGSYTITGAMGNGSGWDQQVDIRTFTDANGNTLDLNHDGIADFVGMGPQGLVYAFGNASGTGGAYGLDPLQTALIRAGNSADLGEAQGWSNAVTLRYIVSDPQTGFDDILALGAPGVFVSMGQDPATHGGEAFGQLYLAMPDFGSDQGWSVQQTPRIVGDVNGDGIPDIVGFGANSTFAAIGSRDATGHLQFALDMTRTISDFGFNEDWSGADPQTIRTLGDVAGSGHSDLILSGAFNTQVWTFN